MITQRMMVRGVKTVPDVWQFTINTEATAAGEKKTGIPFNLYGQDGVKLTVDWGDGNTSILTSADYEELDSSASVHEYDTAGIYTIKISSKQWNKCYIFVPNGDSTNTSNLPTTLNDAVLPLYWYQRTLSATEPLPKFNGINYYYNNSSPSTLNKQNNSASHIFERCTKLTSIADKLFSKNSTTTVFIGTFEGCVSLVSIPGDIFQGVDGRNFAECFEGCFALEEIPEDLFKDCVNATGFSETFRYCKTITSIPAGLFADNNNASDFSSCFMYCSELATIPSTLFVNQSNALDFNQCFSAIKITSIPAGVFDACTRATNFRRVFSDCTHLSTIPDYLFRYNTAAISFMGAFAGFPNSSSTPSYNEISHIFLNANPISITSIPATLFRGATSAINFENTFEHCKNLTSIPSGLFDDNNAAESFKRTFSDCQSISTIPSGLFDNNSLATRFDSAFQNCSALTSIPSGLFDNNVLATDFDQTFEYCDALQTIPVDLFKYNAGITTANYCFFMDPVNQLGDFSLRIGSSLISNCTSFVRLNSNATRTIYVPSGSTTETTFNAVASSLGLTIIGE